MNVLDPSLAELGSDVMIEIALTMLVTPPVAFAGTCTTTVKSALVPAVNTAGKVQRMLPFVPTAGVLHVAVGPEFCTTETNVVAPGVNTRSSAAPVTSGPLFVIVIAYERSVPGTALAGAVTATERSADCASADAGAKLPAAAKSASTRLAMNAFPGIA
ncbi:MAG TPA: hypothetical protein VFJ86_16585 [Usitatibacter sp.]|nr:hypothetical protein [Usitatibacter sp.]